MFGYTLYHLAAFLLALRSSPSYEKILLLTPMTQAFNPCSFLDTCSVTLWILWRTWRRIEACTNVP